MSTYFTNSDGSQIEFGVEICEKFQKFLHILDDIHQDYNIVAISLFMYGEDFSLHFKKNTISFGAKSNPEGYTISFRNVLGLKGSISTNTLQAILVFGDNFRTTIKKPRYEVFESVMKTLCKAKKIQFAYFCG